MVRKTRSRPRAYVDSSALIAFLDKSDTYTRYLDMTTGTHARLFWSGGSQAVRLPKAMRLPGKQVIMRRRGATVILEPLPDADDWTGFWDRIMRLARPIRRGKTRKAERRASL